MQKELSTKRSRVKNLYLCRYSGHKCQLSKHIKRSKISPKHQYLLMTSKRPSFDNVHMLSASFKVSVNTFVMFICSVYFSPLFPHPTFADGCRSSWSAGTSETPQGAQTRREKKRRERKQRKWRRKEKRENAVAKNSSVMLEIALLICWAHLVSWTAVSI